MTEENLHAAAPTAAEGDLKQPSGPSSKKKRKKWPIVVGVCAAVLVIAGASAWIWHEQPSFCGTVCHDTMGSYSEGWADSDFMVHAHAEQGVTCLQCHEPEISEQIAELQVQFKGEYRLPLAKMEVEDEFCLRDGCHTREEIQAVTVASTDGQEVMPHTMSVDESVAPKTDPHNSGNGTLTCSTCHTSHRKSQEINYCYDSCHHTKTFEVCVDCHDVAE